MIPNRLQMYSLIIAFEQDMRAILERYVVNLHGMEHTLGEFIEGARERSRKDTALDDSLLHWLSLRDEYDLLNRHRNDLPAPLASEIRELTGDLVGIEMIRHTVMHGRPLRSHDPEGLITTLSKFQHPLWSELRSLIRRLNQDPTWVPENPPTEVNDDRILHNLPPSDFDETGLLGRDAEVEKVLAAVLRRRDPVITLVGEGGVGKTALALQVAYRLIDQDDCSFEMVLWVSLKTERLTAYGVEAITNGIDSLLGATRELGSAASGGQFEGGLEELARVIRDVPTLICFDNLETISGDEFVLLYEALPDTVSYLVTSREGIGQIERRIPVGPLAEKDALNLFNQLVKVRGVQALINLSKDTRAQVVRSLPNTPLALRWFVLGVEAGREPLFTLRNQHELVDYCVASVFENLNEDSRYLLRVIHAVARPISTEELTVLADISARSAQKAMRPLLAGSLISHVTLDDLRTSVEIAETARKYLDRHLDDRDMLALKVAGIDRDLQAFEEDRRRGERKRSLDPNTIHSGAGGDRAAAFLLRKALQASARGEFDGALSFVEEARQLNPEYWEVWRVEGTILGYAGRAAASSKYLFAYDLAKDPGDRAIVAHFYAGHLARHEKDLEGALPYARQAFEQLRTPDAAASLGNLLVWNREYKEGLSHLAWALQEGESSGKGRKITIGAIVKALRRRAEDLFDADDLRGSWDSAWMGWVFAVREMDRGTTEDRLLDEANELAVWGLRCLRIADQHALKLPGKGTLLDSIMRRSDRLSARRRQFEYLVVELRKLASLSRDSQGAQDLLNAIESSLGPIVNEGFSTVMTSETLDDPAAWLPGTIARVEKTGYGFIAPTDSIENVFFHVSCLREIPWRSLVIGEEVEWLHGLDDKGREQAQAVRRIQRVIHSPLQAGGSADSHEIKESTRISGQTGFISGPPGDSHIFAVVEMEIPITVIIPHEALGVGDTLIHYKFGDQVTIDAEASESLWRASSVKLVKPLALDDLI